MGKLKNEINSEQIAKLAGVSRSTVSRVINNYSNVPTETYEKVMKVIRQYNYFPNISAQALKGKETKTLGFFMVSPGHFSEDILCNFMIGKVIENASLQGYHVLSYIIRDAKDQENIRMVKEVFYQRRIDGGVFIGAENHEPLVEELIAEGFIIGIMDQNLRCRTESNRIVVNFECEDNAVYAVDYLVSLNHKKIAFINGSLNKYSGIQKNKGFMKGIEKHKLNVPSCWITYGDFDELGGYNAMKKILNSSCGMPTAVCAANDNTAFGAIKAIQEQGLGVPEDISIIGIDDHMLSAYFKPTLTTFRVDFTEIIRLLISGVIEGIEKDTEKEFVKVELNTEFIERESCRKIQ